MNIPPDALALIGTGAKWLAGAAPATVAVWRLLSHDRTLLYALLPWVGKKVDARKLQETVVAESQKAYAAEVKLLGKQTDVLTQKFLKSKSDQRLMVQRDLEYVESRKREVEIKFAAVKDIAAEKSKRDARKHTPHTERISGHWMDQFDELVRRRNEDWRALLLKDALVREAQEPGSISPRLLWLVGLLEPEKFEILSALLNLASTVDGKPMLPGDLIYQYRKIVPGLEERQLTIGSAAVGLSDTGLLEDRDVGLQLNKGETIVAGYDGKRIELTALELNCFVKGVAFSTLGSSIANLYNATANSFGHELFERWVERIIPTQYSVKRL